MIIREQKYTGSKEMRLLLGDSIRETGDEIGIPESGWFDGPYHFHGTGLP
jgi:hypothetical protein